MTPEQQLRAIDRALVFGFSVGFIVGVIVGIGAFL